MEGDMMTIHRNWMGRLWMFAPPDNENEEERRSTPLEVPDAPRAAREDEPEFSLPEPLANAFRQTDELHQLLSTVDAVLQRARVRVHIIEAELARMAGRVDA